MKISLLKPPIGQNSIWVAGRTYSSTAGVAIEVPDYDAAALLSAGWIEAPLVSPGGVLSVQSGGSTNDSSSGSGGYIDHTPTFTIPANFMIAARAFRVTAHFQLTTGSTVPTLTTRLLLGSAVLFTTGTAGNPTVSQTNVQAALVWIFQATQAPGAASNVQCTPVAFANLAYLGLGLSITAMPVAVATNAAQVLKIASQWSAAGVGTNTIGLNQLIVEVLN